MNLQLQDMDDQYFEIDGVPYMSNMGSGQIVRLVDMLVFNTSSLRPEVLTRRYPVITKRQAVALIDKLVGNKALIFPKHLGTRMAWYNGHFR